MKKYKASITVFGIKETKIGAIKELIWTLNEVIHQLTIGEKLINLKIKEIKNGKDKNEISTDSSNGSF